MTGTGPPSTDRHSRGLQGRRLYLVQARVVHRASHVPVGRTLHLVDLENLMGGPLTGILNLQAASTSYREVVPPGPTDHVIVAANPRLCVEAQVAWPGSRILARSGADGADLALIDSVRDVNWIAARYDRIIIGSGDGIFANIADAYVRAGLPVGVVARQRSLARVLADAASFIHLMPDAERSVVA